MSEMLPAALVVTADSVCVDQMSRLYFEGIRYEENGQHFDALILHAAEFSDKLQLQKSLPE